jgi:hypothetical protein
LNFDHSPPKVVSSGVDIDVQTVYVAGLICEHWFNVQKTSGRPGLNLSASRRLVAA